MFEINKDPVSMVEDSMGTVLLKALVTELKMSSPRFVSQTEEAQQEVIDRLRLQIAESVRDAVAAISARSFEKVAAKIVSVTFKDEVKVTLEMGRIGEGVHSVADAVGGQVMLVLCDLEAFTGGMESAVKPTPAQRDWTQPDD